MKKNINSELIIRLEKTLFSRELPVSELSELIDDSFSEYGHSGNLMNKEDVINWLRKKNPSRIVAHAFHVKPVSSEVVLVTYISSIFKETHKVQKDFRTSVWRRNSGKWMIFYHQATPISAE